jgi:hypothetical protein
MANKRFEWHQQLQHLAQQKVLADQHYINIALRRVRPLGDA